MKFYLYTKYVHVYVVLECYIFFLFSKYNTTSQWWCNAKYVHLECCSSWVKVQFRSKPKTI